MDLAVNVNNQVLFTFSVDIEFMLFYLDNVDETRCDNPTKTDVETCNDFGDELCSSFGIVTVEKGRKCFKGCGVMCSKK